jgi:hypothetical protein
MHGLAQHERTTANAWEVAGATARPLVMLLQVRQLQRLPLAQELCVGFKHAGENLQRGEWPARQGLVSCARMVGWGGGNG